MLHIHNGDCSAETAKQSTIPGEHFAWSEALIDGPAPTNVSEAEWHKLRAAHLSESYGVDANDTEDGLRAQEDKLKSYPEHDEVVLWFEQELFCQVNLLYLLDWFSQSELGKTRLSLIFVGEFPGVPNFHGLGELTPEQMASLFPARQEVTPAEFELATKAWAAYRSSDPTEIERLLETDCAAMPFLKQALRLHLERFPFVRNGLGRIQNKGLEFIQNGLHKFSEIFPRFANEERFYGLGDSQFWNALNGLTHTPEPLLKTNGSSTNGHLNPEKMRQAEFEMTETGTAVLNGDGDFVEINGLDTWLGGVHLNGNADVWRWDDQRERLVLT